VTRVEFPVSPLTCVVAVTTLALPCECVINKLVFDSLVSQL